MKKHALATCTLWRSSPSFSSSQSSILPLLRSCRNKLKSPYTVQTNLGRSVFRDLQVGRNHIYCRGKHERKYKFNSYHFLHLLVLAILKPAFVNKLRKSPQQHCHFFFLLASYCYFGFSTPSSWIVRSRRLLLVVPLLLSSVTLPWFTVLYLYDACCHIISLLSL